MKKKTVLMSIIVGLIIICSFCFNFQQVQSSDEYVIQEAIDDHEGIIFEKLSEINDGPGSRGLTVKDDLVFVADYTDGLEIIDITNNSNPLKVGNYSAVDITLNVKVEGDFVFIADRLEGMKIINFSNLSNLQLVGTYYNGSGQTWDMIIEGDYAFIADGLDGLEIVNITDPENPEQYGAYNAGFRIDTLKKKDNYCLLCSQDKGMVIVNVTDLSNPVKVANYTDDDFIFTDIQLIGDRAYISDFNLGLMIFDISNISDPELIGEFTGSGKYSQSFVRGEHVYLAGEELEVVNTSNLNNIIEIAYDPYVGLTTGIHVTDTHVYLTDYFGGLLILSWLKDSDNDLLSDEEELTLGEDGFITNPNNWDTDGDQLTDFQEMTYDTDPTDEDSDDDELSDYEEIYTHDTDPLDSDSDDDNLSDYDEIFTHGTDPNDDDSDNDGFTDDEEINNGSDPLNPSITPKAGLNVIMISLLGIASLLGLLVMRRRK